MTIWFTLRRDHALLPERILQPGRRKGAVGFGLCSRIVRCFFIEKSRRGSFAFVVRIKDLAGRRAI
jgi:hypothetical protein